MTPHLPFDATRDRITELQAVAAAAHAPASDGASTRDAPSGPLTRLRDGIGIRLIELGAAMVSDDRLRRPEPRS